MKTLTNEEISLIYENLNMDEGTLETAAERAGIDISGVSEYEIEEALREKFKITKCHDGCGSWSYSLYRCDLCGARMDGGGPEEEWGEFPTEERR